MKIENSDTYNAYHFVRDLAIGTTTLIVEIAMRIIFSVTGWVEPRYPKHHWAVILFNAIDEAHLYQPELGRS